MDSRWCEGGKVFVIGPMDPCRGGLEVASYVNFVVGIGGIVAGLGYPSNNLRVKCYVTCGVELGHVYGDCEDMSARVWDDNSRRCVRADVSWDSNLLYCAKYAFSDC